MGNYLTADGQSLAATEVRYPKTAADRRRLRGVLVKVR